MKLKSIKMIIDSDLNNVSLIGMAVRKLCSIIPLSDLEAYEIELCVVEAVNNAIIHGYNNEKGHEVEIVFTLFLDKLVLDVYDKGKGIDEECVKHFFHLPLSGIDLTDTKGRGIYIIRNIMNKVEYKNIHDKNLIRMTKFLDIKGEKKDQSPLEHRKEAEVLILKVKDKRLDATKAVPFKEKMSEFINAGNKLIVLNLSEVDFIDSNGLGAIISALKKVCKDGDIVICNPKDTIKTLFKLIRMDRVFRLFETEEEAIKEISKF